jgi:hypothetical protein
VSSKSVSFQDSFGANFANIRNRTLEAEEQTSVYLQKEDDLNTMAPHKPKVLEKGLQ